MSEVKQRKTKTKNMKTTSDNSTAGNSKTVPGEKKSKNSKSKEEIQIFGFDVSFLEGASLFVALSFGHVLCSVVFAFCQEKVITFPGFKKYAQFITLSQTLIYTICAGIEVQTSRGKLGNLQSPSAPLSTYIMLSFLTFGGMYLTNAGLKYLTYPTRIIFKSGKPIPTMIIEYLYVGKVFSKSEISSVALLTVAIILFSLGEAQGSPNFDVRGVLFMFGGVIADSCTSSYEKKVIFLQHKASHAEAMFFASLFGTVWSIVTILLNDPSSFFSALSFILQNTSVLVPLVLSAVGGYLSVSFVLLLIKHFSATYAECVKGGRKIISIILSYVLLSDPNKSFGWHHGFGMMNFVGSIFSSVYARMKNRL